jgi:hypothetical protein
VATVSRLADREFELAPPGDLSAVSQARWPGLVADIVAGWPRACVPSEATLLLLANTLRMVDRLDQVAAVLAEGVTAEGSKGQVRAHPLLGVEMALQREVAKAFTELGLAGYSVRNLGVDETGRVVGHDRGGAGTGRGAGATELGASCPRGAPKARGRRRRRTSGN